MFRGFVALILLLALICGAAFIVAGRGAPPLLAIVKPERVVGQTGTLEVTAEAPKARFTTLTVVLEQNGKRVPLVDLGAANRGEIAPRNANSATVSVAPGTATSGVTVSDAGPNKIRITRGIGKSQLPELQAGAARIVVTAVRPSFLNLRQLSSSASKDFQVRLDPPRIAVLSTKHYVNHGGSELVVYKATPPDVQSGVRVGDVEYPGFPASGAGVEGADPALRVAFFALLHDQPLDTRIQAFARDEAGNESKASFVDNVFEKPFKKSRIALDDKFINRVVPEILEHAPELKLAAPAEGTPEMLQAFLKINGELRKINANQIAALALKTAPTRLWEGPFVQLGNSQVEASFADHRTYVYGGKEVDQQVHLGFDLAVTAARAGARGQQRRGGQRELARHLRQLRDPRPRPRRPDAVRPPDRRSTWRSATKWRGASRSAAATRPASPAATTCTSRSSSAAGW